MAGKIIPIFNQKGGCGKTMVAMHIGGVLGALGFRVCVVDMDTQRTATQWFSHSVSDRDALPLDVVALGEFGAEFLGHIGPILKEYDLVLIDCPPALESNVPWIALLAADYALVPVFLDDVNLWASKGAFQLIQQARKLLKKGGKKAFDSGIVCPAVERGMVSDNNFLALEVMSKTYDIPIFKSKMVRRQAFKHGPSLGASVDPRKKRPESIEALAVAQELLKALKIPVPKLVPKAKSKGTSAVNK